MTDTKTMGLGAALERLLTWPNPDGTIEKAYIPAWLARDCRAALAQQEAVPVAWGSPDAEGNIVSVVTEDDRIEDDTSWTSQYTVPLYAAAPVAQPAQETAKQRYDRLMVDGEEQDPVERLRYFCSIALTPQDWLDVEQFFSDVTKAQPAQPLTDDQIKSACGASDVYWAHSKLFIIGIARAIEAAHGIKGGGL